MKTVVIFLDTVRKDMLKTYNNKTDVDTPNLDMLAQDSYIFENHCTGSLPCMPARRDFFTGRLDFFDRPWGALEPYDLVLQKELSINNIPSHIITDHAHYWRHGGENYLQYFDTYIMNRGQESDPYISYIDECAIPKNVHGRFNLQFYKNNTDIKSIKDFPVYKTFNKACDFLELNKDEESFYLQIEGFDPHEPFNVPEQFLKQYNVTNIGEYYNSPIYGKCNDTEKELNHLRGRYKASLSFVDSLVGKVICKLKDLKIYDECNIIFTSDHGFQLGEHNFLGKGMTHIYNEICEIPLFHKLPNQKQSKHIDVFTQNIDIMPTLLEQYNITGNYSFHGQSYISLLNNKPYKERDSIVSAYFGQSLTYKDKNYTYLKPKINGVTEHALTAIPRIMYGYMGSNYEGTKVKYTEIENGRYLKHTKYPVYNFKTVFPSKDLNTELYNNNDKKQLINIITTELEYIYDQKVLNKLNEYGINDFYLNTFNFNYEDK